MEVTHFTALEDALLLVTVHQMDLLGFGKNRSWKWIRAKNYTRRTEDELMGRFAHLCSASPLKNPFPNPETYDYPVIPRHLQASGGNCRMFNASDPVAAAEWNESKICELLEAATIVYPFTLFSPKCITFMGYGVEQHQTIIEEDLKTFERRYIEVKRRLTPAQLMMYETWESEARLYAGVAHEEFVTLVEMGKVKLQKHADQTRESQMKFLLDHFRDRKRLLVQRVYTDSRACALIDVAFYRRIVVGGRRNSKVGEVMSDYEMMRLYMRGEKTGFKFEKASFEQWGSLLRKCDIVDVTGHQAYWNFFMYCVPRLGFLSAKIEPAAKPTKGVQFKHHRYLVNIILFHAIQRFTVVGILKTLYQFETVYNMKGVFRLVCNGVSVHRACMSFAHSVLTGCCYDFKTSFGEFDRRRTELVNDIRTNWSKFKYDVEGNKLA